MSLRAAVRPRRPDAPPPDPQRRVIVLVGLAVAGFLVFLPARQLISEKMRIVRLEQRLDALHRENRTLSREVERLRDPEELELLARDELGLVKPGEQAYILVPQPTPRPPPPPPPKPGALARAWRWIAGLVTGDR